MRCVKRGKYSMESKGDADPPAAQIPAKRPRTAREDLSEDCSDSSEEIIPFHRLSTCVLYSSEDEDAEHSSNKTTLLGGWTNPTGNQPCLKSFSATPSFKISDQPHEQPEDIYSLFMNDEFFDLVVTETNRYAQQCLPEQKSRSGERGPTDKNEMKCFFGLIMWMGIVKLPEISLYWSKDPAYSQTLPPWIMSRNRFEFLLRMLHFNDNLGENVSDRLDKIKAVVDMLNKNFQKYFQPGETLCIDECLIPFPDCHDYRQYLHQKRHKRGIKILKLCSAPGYTLAFRVYCGKTTPADVQSLCKSILDEGHTVCTDKWATSVELAKSLVVQNTHLVGTIRPRHGIPKDVLSKKLHRYEYIAKENKDGFTILKWKEKRDVLFLSTKHSNETVAVQKKGNSVRIPKVVVDYNEGRSSADVSEGMYCNPVTNSLKWYQKVVFELCLNVAVTNSWIMYNNLTDRKITGIEFREKLIMGLTSSMSSSGDGPRRRRHQLKKKEGSFNSMRKRCRACYERNVKSFGSQTARSCTVKVVTYCDGCEGEPHFCLPCFNKVHADMPW